MLQNWLPSATTPWTLTLVPPTKQICYFSFNFSWNFGLRDLRVQISVKSRQQPKSQIGSLCLFQSVRYFAPAAFWPKPWSLNPSEGPHLSKHEKLTAPVRAELTRPRLCTRLGWSDPKQLPVTGSSFKLAPGWIYLVVKRDNL